MRKNMLTLCAVLAMTLGSSSAFAETANCITAVPENPCLKSNNSDAATLAAYESCMAEFVKSQNQALENHRTAISRADAAMEQARTEAGSK